MSTLRDFFPPVTPATQPFMQVQDQKPTGTGGGASVAGDNHRDLNTVLHNDIVGASLASNQVTLPAGTYYVEAISNGMFAAGDLNKLNRLQIISPNTTLTGVNFYSYSAYGGLQPKVSGSIILPVPGVIAVSMYMNEVKTVTGLGYPLSQPPHEVYTDLRIWQLKEGI